MLQHIKRQPHITWGTAAASAASDGFIQNHNANRCHISDSCASVIHNCQDHTDAVLSVLTYTTDPVWLSNELRGCVQPPEITSTEHSGFCSGLLLLVCVEQSTACTGCTGCTVYIFCTEQNTVRWDRITPSDGLTGPVGDRVPSGVSAGQQHLNLVSLSFHVWPCRDTQSEGGVTHFSATPRRTRQILKKEAPGCRVQRTGPDRALRPSSTAAHSNRSPPFIHAPRAPTSSWRDTRGFLPVSTRPPSVLLPFPLVSFDIVSSLCLRLLSLEVVTSLWTVDGTAAALPPVLSSPSAAAAAAAAPWRPATPRQGEAGTGELRPPRRSPLAVDRSQRTRREGLRPRAHSPEAGPCARRAAADILCVCCCICADSSRVMMPTQLLSSPEFLQTVPALQLDCLQRCAHVRGCSVCAGRPFPFPASVLWLCTKTHGHTLKKKCHDEWEETAAELSSHASEALRRNCNVETIHPMCAPVPGTTQLIK